MSDRIDELWELVTSDFIDEQSRLIYARELATIAREAEVRALTWQLTTENTQKLLNEATARAIEREKKYREAIADRDEWIDRCYQSDERADKAEAEADKLREAAFCVAYAWWEQDEDSATDYLLERGWDTDRDFDGPMSFESLVEDVRQQPHPTALAAAREAVIHER